MLKAPLSLYVLLDVHTEIAQVPRDPGYIISKNGILPR